MKNKEQAIRTPEGNKSEIKHSYVPPKTVKIPTPPLPKSSTLPGKKK